MRKAILDDSTVNLFFGVMILGKRLREIFKDKKQCNKQLNAFGQIFLTELEVFENGVLENKCELIYTISVK